MGDFDKPEWLDRAMHHELAQLRNRYREAAIVIHAAEQAGLEELDLVLRHKRGCRR